ncbi:hypothetical protein H632_c3452p0, partial [Helicosporidium sp. ATCC 50920]
CIMVTTRSRALQDPTEALSASAKFAGARSSEEDTGIKAVQVCQRLTDMSLNEPSVRPSDGVLGSVPTKTPVKLRGDDRPLKKLPDTIQACDKLPDGPEPAQVSIEFPERSELTRLAKAGARVPAAAKEANSPDWVAACRALLDLRRAAAHEEDAGLVREALPELLPRLVAGVRSLRSSLCRTAIMTCADVFQSFGDA